MPKITTVSKSRKPHVCGACRAEIPIGESYRKTKPRYGAEKIRCMRPACDFKPTDLSSSKAARIEEAVNEARKAIYSTGAHDEIQAVLQEVADVAREVADEYQEASDSWAGGNGNEEFQEKADACGSFADDLEGWSYSGETDEDAIRAAVAEDEERDAAESEEDYAERIEPMQDEAWEDELQSMRDEASGVLDGLDL